MFDRLRFDFLLEACSPVAHASESLGNSTLLMREKRRLPDGQFVHVPIVSGDTMRHGLREAASYAFLDAAGLLDTPALTEAALRLLFAGGMITGSAGPTLRIDEWREIAELMPHVALLGGCAQNRIIPGKIQVESADLVCDETAHRLSPWQTTWLRTHGVALQPARSHIEEVQRVRMDPSLDPAKRKLLTDGGSVVEKRLRASEQAKESGDAPAAEVAKSSMMPRRYETVVSGSLFAWSLVATVHSDLERDTLHTMIGAFLAHARVGGKRGTGHGQLRAIAAHQVTVLRPAETSMPIDPATLAPKVGSLFLAHVRERAERVTRFLREVEA